MQAVVPAGLRCPCPDVHPGSLVRPASKVRLFHGRPRLSVVCGSRVALAIAMHFADCVRFILLIVPLPCSGSLSPMRCARDGWCNVGIDTLGCPLCGNHIVYNEDGFHCDEAQQDGGGAGGQAAMELAADGTGGAAAMVEDGAEEAETEEAETEEAAADPAAVEAEILDKLAHGHKVGGMLSACLSDLPIVMPVVDGMRSQLLCALQVDCPWKTNPCPSSFELFPPAPTHTLAAALRARARLLLLQPVRRPHPGPHPHLIPSSLRSSLLPPAPV